MVTKEQYDKFEKQLKDKEIILCITDHNDHKFELYFGRFFKFEFKEYGASIVFSHAISMIKLKGDRQAALDAGTKLSADHFNNQLIEASIKGEACKRKLFGGNTDFIFLNTHQNLYEAIMQLAQK